MDDSLLTVSDLCFHYTHVDVIRHLDMTLRRGEFIGIYGDNGAGKSTLIKLLLGQLKPCQGSVHWSGETPEGTSTFSSIGYVPQRTMHSHEFFPATVQEVVMANLYRKIGLFRRPKKRHREMVQNALAMVGMQGFEKRQIAKLSGGQMQRIYIARALVNAPQVLLLDEPTSGVDAHTVSQLFDVLSHLNHMHAITIVMITHDREAARAIVSRGYVLEEGRLVPEEVEHAVDR